MSMLQRYVPDSFPLPHEVFELGLSHGPLLVYISLVYHKSLKHGADTLSCTAINKLVGLCVKSVQTHRNAVSTIVWPVVGQGGKGGKNYCAVITKEGTLSKKLERTTAHRVLVWI